MRSIPDNTATGGNCRGINSTDLQVSRTVATQIASGNYALLGGGQRNTVSGNYAAVIAGTDNTASGEKAFIGAGEFNTASAPYTFIGGGSTNTASTQLAAVIAGTNNVSSGTASLVGAGINNQALQHSSVVVAGDNNIVNGINGFVGAGDTNSVQGDLAFIGAGTSNTASGTNAMIPGGVNNTVTGASGFAAGTQAKSLHNGSFVMSDDTASDYSSTTSKQFSLRFANGFVYSGAGSMIVGNVAGDVYNQTANTSTATAANAIIRINTANLNAGDPKLVMTVNGATDWSIGIDNSSADDRLKIGNSDIIGNNTRLDIASSEIRTYVPLFLNNTASGYTPSALSYYAETTSTITATGAASITMTFKFTRVGRMVTIVWPDGTFTAASNSAVTFPNAIPLFFQTSNLNLVIFIKNNGALSTGILSNVGANLVFYSTNQSNWTAGTSCAIWGCSVSWST
jgi:hypothetical protein